MENYIFGILIKFFSISNEKNNLNFFVVVYFDNSREIKSSLKSVWVCVCVCVEIYKLDLKIKRFVNFNFFFKINLLKKNKQKNVSIRNCFFLLLKNKAKIDWFQCINSLMKY